MLYHARDARVLKAGYHMKYVSVHQPGSDVKYVPVYRSPTGDEVFENEATVEGIEIVEVRGTTPSRNERELAIKQLTAILCRSSLLNVDRRHVGLAYEGCTHRSWAREHLDKLVGTNVI